MRVKLKINTNGSNTIDAIVNVRKVPKHGTYIRYRGERQSPCEERAMIFRGVDGDGVWLVEVP